MKNVATDVCAQGHVTVFRSDFLYQMRWSAALSGILAEPCLSLHVLAKGYRQTLTNTAFEKTSFSEYGLPRQPYLSLGCSQ